MNVTATARSLIAAASRTLPPLAPLLRLAAEGTPATPAEAGVPLRVLYGTQTGNAETVAQAVAATARRRGFAPTLATLDETGLDELAETGNVLVVTSTYGSGEMPDSAHLFWQDLNHPSAPPLDGLAYSVLAMGDSGYENFCQAGRDLDRRLAELGAWRAHPRQDCDTDYGGAATTWATGALEALATLNNLAPPTQATAPTAATAPIAPGPARTVQATVTTRRLLSRPGSSREVRHYELDLSGTGIAHEPGDCLGVVPCNDPDLVERVLDRLGADPADVLPNGVLPGGEPPLGDVPLGDLLANRVELRAPTRALLAAAGSGRVDGADVLDVLDRDPHRTWAPEEVVPLLAPLVHRAYSISSSPRAHPGSAHLTVSTVRHRARGRARGGACSTHLADRVGPGGSAQVRLLPNRHFRLPAADVPVVMVGPGTGVAPFRAFLQDREATAATGRNWLLTGGRHRATDHLYGEDLARWGRSGLLTRLDLAFSRDGADKVYVQHLMLDSGAELFGWLEDGAHLYVCGDASGMAGAVDEALRTVASVHGGLGPEGAVAYVEGLWRGRRYHRDVY